MVNKNGYLRTIEALISVIALLAVLLVIMPKEQIEKKVPDIVTSSHNYFLDLVINSKEERNCILNGNLKAIKCPSQIECEECGQIGNTIECNTKLDNALKIVEAAGFTTKCLVCKTKPTDRSCFFKDSEVKFPDTDIYVNSVLVIDGDNERLVRLFSYTS